MKIKNYWVILVDNRMFLQNINNGFITLTPDLQEAEKYLDVTTAEIDKKVLLLHENNVVVRKINKPYE